MRREIENENFKRGGKGIVNKKQKWFVRERERERKKKNQEIVEETKRWRKKDSHGNNRE